MSQPPVNPYPSQPGSGAPYGSQPGAYPPPQQPGGYPASQPGSPYPAPQQPGGYPPPQPAGGFPPPAPGAPGQPYGAVPPPPKKRSTGKILLIVLAAVLVLCLGGAAVAFFAVKDEVKETVDATKIRVVEPETLAGRPKVTDPNLQNISQQLEAELNKSLPDATSTVGAFYGDPAKQDLVMVAAASGLNTDPTKTLDETVAGARQSDVAVGEMSSVDPGPLGGEAKCGDAKAADVPIGVCVWSDKGSLGMIMVYFKTGADVQKELATMRGQIEQKS
ncbi:hypothetical protein [Micromonospora thermarum]|uniref:Flagellar basal body-associated protein FliL n=1 Tax=Micromonospora thermarum TaxID=2720024 RepID=A0ABX0Z1E3_9ACTN|nr:hypothetical protein [Micromonospora thermarum]NJP31602.1 hypothetical protein [Micromonospora thermarum]